MICDICQVPKRSHRSVVLFEHWLRFHTPHPSRQYKVSCSCDACGRQYTRKSDLAIHIMDRHNFADRWTAHIFCRSGCGLTFALKRTENYHHRKYHTMPGPFFCDTCSQEMQDKNCLVMHLQRTRKRHAISIPYVCDACSRVYTRKDHLLSHLKRSCAV